MEESAYKVYCAGPLFNPKEREEMAQIASVLEDAGYSAFLPQRDGLEFGELFPRFVEKGMRVEDAQLVLNMAIFSLDVFEIIESDGLVLNMNGRVPDEGAMVEAGIGWAHNKSVVVFRSDTRSLIEGNCNPLVLGLSDFSVVNSYDQIVPALEAKFGGVKEDAFLGRAMCFERAFTSGKQISEHLAVQGSRGDLVELLVTLFRERICLDSKEANANYSATSMQP